MQLHRTASPLTREERNKVNENWDKIEQNYNNVVEIVSNKAYQQVVNSAKIDWLSPVGMFEDIETTYPDAVEGNAVMIRNTGKVYRKNESNEWEEIQEIAPTAINELDNRLSQKIENAEQDINDINDHISIMIKGRFNVTDFGAKLDGITDDTQAFQLCADAISANDGGVFDIPFTKSGAVINGTVKMPSNVIVEGNGALIIASSSNNADTPFMWENKKNIHVNNLRVDGMKELKDNQQSIGGGSNGFTFKGECNHIRIQNCEVFNTLEHGVHLFGEVRENPIPSERQYNVAHCTDVEITGCTFENNGNPFWSVGPRGAGIMMILGQENIKIHHNTFKNFVRVGIYADSAFETNLEELYPGLSISSGDYTGKDSYISDNEFIVDVDYWENITSGDSGVGIAIHGQQRLSAVNNKIRLLAGKYRGISIDDSQENSPTDNIMISHNYIESNFYTIEIKNATYVNVDNNQLINLSGLYDTIRIEYKTKSTQEILIQNNLIRNKDYAGIYIFNESGTSSNLNGVFLLNNRILNTGNTTTRSAGIWLSRAMDDIEIRGNTIKSGYYGINIGADATNAFVRDNKISHANTAINSTAPIIVAFNAVHESTTGIVATNANAKKYSNIINGVMS